MATKTSVSAVSPQDTAAPVKGAAEPVKLESQEELRRRRAGIACFL